MENLIKNNHDNKKSGLGVLMICIGAIFLLRNIGLDFPHWIFSWHTIMLAAGLWIGYRKNFEGSGWLALTIIGGIFTLGDITLFDFNLSRINVSLVLIALGIYVMLKPKKTKTFQYFEQPSSGKEEIRY